jgi:transketolase
MRPGDANEVAECWRTIMAFRHHPVCLVLSRQAMPTLDRSRMAPASGAQKGAYVLVDSDKPEVILMATGTEVGLAVDAYDRLTKDGVRTRVVSMPSWELFEEQDDAYKKSVLPPEIRARVSIELASAFGWQRYVGTGGAMIGMSTFGASAPLKDLTKKFGFSADAVVAAAKAQVERFR